MAKKFKQTFSEIVAEVRVESEDDRGRRQNKAVRSGTSNVAGDLVDPSGVSLKLAKSDLTPAEAAELVRAGASLAFESCGCGGGLGGCEIGWFQSEEVVRMEPASAPTFVKGYGSPTWIDLWSGDDRKVVFAHGDVEWDSVLS